MSSLAKSGTICHKKFQNRLSYLDTFYLYFLPFYKLNDVLVCILVSYPKYLTFISLEHAIIKKNVCYLF
jgi:hypothetical protein